MYLVLNSVIESVPFSCTMSVVSNGQTELNADTNRYMYIMYIMFGRCLSPCDFYFRLVSRSASPDPYLICRQRLSHFLCPTLCISSWAPSGYQMETWAAVKLCVQWKSPSVCPVSLWFTLNIYNNHLDADLHLNTDCGSAPTPFPRLSTSGSFYRHSSAHVSKDVKLFCLRLLIYQFPLDILLYTLSSFRPTRGIYHQSKRKNGRHKDMQSVRNKSGTLRY